MSIEVEEKADELVEVKHVPFAFYAHMEKWKAALKIAIEENLGDGRAYWEHEMKALVRAKRQFRQAESENLENKKSAFVPEDFFTHQSAWRKAVELAGQCEGHSERLNYLWEETLKEFDSAYGDLLHAAGDNVNYVLQKAPANREEDTIESLKARVAQLENGINDIKSQLAAGIKRDITIQHCDAVIKGQK